MGIILTFVVNAGLGFALSLAVARFLGPEEFGRFGIAATVAILLNTALFDWLRLSATRFYGEGSRAAEPAVRATLDVAYLGVVGTLTAFAAAVALAGADLGLPAALLAGAAAAGVLNALFDYRTALARARFLDRAYAGLVLAKNAGAFALMVGGAALTGNALWVVAGGCLSTAAALLPARRALRDPAARPALFEPALLARFAAYALPVVAANAAYQAIILLNRGVAAGALGFAEAGQLALATDLSIRLFSAAGAALDVYLFQLAVRAEERNGREAAGRQVARNGVLVLALLAPLAAGFLAVMPAFEALLVPPAFRGSFAGLTALLLPGVVAYCLLQFALNPVFQIARRTGPAIAAALLALAADAGLLLAFPIDDPAAFAGVHAAALGVGFLAALAFAARTARHGPALRDVLAVLLAAGAMAAAVWPLRDLQPAGLALAAAVAAGAPLYGALLLLFDVAGSRGLAAGILKRRRPEPAE